MPESKTLTGARPALAFARGDLTEDVFVHVPAEFDVKALRRKLGISQAKFPASFSVGLDALQSWEQGRCRPEGPARILFKVIEHDPDAVRRARWHNKHVDAGPAPGSPSHELGTCSRNP